MTRWLAAVCLLTLTASAASATQRPEYLRRLDPPVAEDAISYPRAVTADPHTGEVFVCDTRKNRVLIFDAEGLFSFEIAGGDVFSAPFDLAVDADGYLLVLANHQGSRGIIELDFDGLFRRRIDLSGLSASDSEPRLSSLALSPDGRRLYVVDRENRALWILDREGRVERKVDLAAQLSEAEARDLLLGKVDVYADRVLLAVSSTGEIHQFDLDGGFQLRVGIQGGSDCKLGRPAAAALDAEGNLVVVDQQRMLIQRWRPDGNRCLGEYWGLGISPGYLYYPIDTSLGADGRLYVAQGFDGRVQVYEGLAPALELLAEAPIEPAVEQAAAPATEPAPAEEIAVAPAVEAESVLVEAVSTWALAWSDQRIEAYLGVYSADFRPAGGRTRGQWEDLRRIRLARPQWIEVAISDLRIQLAGDNEARARFRQGYSSNAFSDCVLKTLELRRQEGAWQIVEERVEATLPDDAC